MCQYGELKVNKFNVRLNMIAESIEQILSPGFVCVSRASATWREPVKSPGAKAWPLVM